MMMAASSLTLTRHCENVIGAHILLVVLPLVAQCDCAPNFVLKWLHFAFSVTSVNISPHLL
jgi:hypothetical protein